MHYLVYVSEMQHQFCSCSCARHYTFS